MLPCLRPTATLHINTTCQKVQLDTSNVGQPNITSQFCSNIFRHRYTQQQVLAVQTAHRKASSWQDKVALSTVKLLRWGMDFVTGYNSYSPTSNFETKARPMTEQKWITRFIFLESVAGVPGMVAGMLRHLKSIRMMRRDYGW